MQQSCLVVAISKCSSWDKVVICLLRCMWFLVAYSDIDLHTEHIAGVNNTTADQLFRNHSQSFFSSHPSIDSDYTRTRLDITALQNTSQRYYHLGSAHST